MIRKGLLAISYLFMLASSAWGAEGAVIDTGTTAWMLISTALVLLMVPGLAMFYGGLVRSKNVLGTMMHSFVSMAVIGVLWVVCGYSLAFGSNILGGFWGWNSDYFFLKGIDDVIQNGVPEYVLAMFQGKFAIITPALISGALAERVYFRGYTLFIVLWFFAVYLPLCHWVWSSEGWLFNAGAAGVIDLAGGLVIHDLAEERMAKYSTNSLSIRVCSPTIKGMSRIEASYLDSDMRKPHVRCPHCEHNQILKWKNVKWDKGEDGVERHETTSYQCDECGVLWSEFDRHTALEVVDWLQTKKFKCDHCDHMNEPQHWCPNDERDKWDHDGRAYCEECGIGKCPNRHAGFWANKLYSTFRPLSDMVKLWLEVQNNIEKLKMFINTQLAETFEEPGDSIEDVDWLMDRREEWAGQVPEEVGLLTFGADVQNNRIEVEIVGWGKDEESWSVDYKVIAGDPANPETWRRFDEFIMQPFFYANGDYTHIVAGCIDLGGGHTQHVANYCRHRINNRIWPIRGIGGDGRAYPVWPRNPSRTGKIQVPFYNVGVDAAKNVVFQRLLVRDSGAGYCHFPANREEDWFLQLIAERRVKKWKGTKQILVWENPKKARNEAFDNRVYAYAALCGLQSMGMKLNKMIEKRKFILLSDRNKAKLGDDYHAPAKSKKVKRKTKVARSSFVSR